MRIGLLQSRGLGDIVIGLPIAQYYLDQGHTVYWPICEEFVSHFQDSAPQIKWISVPTDTRGDYYWNTPQRLLALAGVDEIIPLYQSLTSHPELQTPEFQITKFDQIKYHRAGVPFLNKWRLAESITRNPTREQELYNRVVKSEHYIVAHLEGSSHRASIDLTALLPDPTWQIVLIEPLTDSIFDWLTVLERAEAIVTVDSVYANIVDQMSIGTDRYFIPRSHIHLTPVLGNTWTVMEPEPDVAKRITIFRSS